MAGYIPRWLFTRPQTVAHPSINRARPKVTTLIETNVLSLSQASTTTTTEVPRRQSHRHLGLATLPSVAAIHYSHPISLQTRGLVVFLYVCVYCVFSVFFCVYLFFSVLWYCWLGPLTCKTVSQITHTVSAETLNAAQSIKYHNGDHVLCR